MGGAFLILFTSGRESFSHSYSRCRISPVKPRGPSYQRRQERRRNAFSRNNEVKPEVINTQVAEQAGARLVDDTMNKATLQGVVVSTNTNNTIVEEPTEEVTGQMEINESSCSVIEEEVDEAELARDKLVDEVIVYAVPPTDIRQPVQGAHDVEEEIRAKFSSMGIDVVNIRHRVIAGKYDSSLVKLTPVNLRRIWGRRLGLSNCAVVEFKQSDVR